MSRQNSIRIPMQFFAEGGEVPPADPPVNTVGTEELTIDKVFEKFKAEDILGSEAMKKSLQSHTDSMITKALATARGKWEQEKLDSLDEAKKLERMSAEEKAKYQFEKERKEFEESKAAFAKQQLQLAVGAELQKRNLPSDFAKYLAGDTAQQSTENINVFEKAFNEAVSNIVNERMRGTPPKDSNGNNKTFTKEQLENMSPEEINKNWSAVSSSMKSL